jgi:hypothetical protein
MEHFVPDLALPGEWVSPSRRQTVQSRQCPPRSNPLTTSNRYSVLDPASIALQYTPERSPGTAYNQRVNKLNAQTHGEAQRQSLFEASIAASINHDPYMPIGSAMAIPPVAIESPNLPAASPDIGPHWPFLCHTYNLCNWEWITLQSHHLQRPYLECHPLLCQFLGEQGLTM